MQAISSTSFSTPVEPGCTLSPTAQKDVGSASNASCCVTEGKIGCLLDYEQDDDSDIVSITATDSTPLTDEFYACSTAEANMFFSELVEECDSTLVSVSGSDPIEPSVSGSNACDELDNASPDIINANIVEPQGLNNKGFEVVIDSLCEEDVENETVFQGICCPVSPPVSFYTESDEPRTSCPSSMSSIVVPKKPIVDSYLPLVLWKRRCQHFHFCRQIS
ncbi:unnamed protein product [Ambrosiozyma monospora]|uniref:Unnamed protein product n=1 Tax=Ambrosiozyma monospora TaxID=43982 RepID=A0A9W6Z738_AMBMO|nr:unnamed protein product [Ambrosiozyma monospora]